MDTKQFEITVEAISDGERRWIKIARVDDTIEVHTDKDEAMDAPHVESADEWGKALGYRVSSIIGSFLQEENIV
jgi:hypothetical protein